REYDRGREGGFDEGLDRRHRALCARDRHLPPPRRARCRRGRAEGVGPLELDRPRAETELELSPLVLEEDDAGLERPRVDEAQADPVAGALEEGLAAAEDDRADVQPVDVDGAELVEGGRDLGAAEQQEVVSRLRL